jgi:transposase
MTPQRLVRRSRIVLLAADGWSNTRIARAVGASVPTVALWRRRFIQGGVECLRQDAPGRGRKPTISAEALVAFIRNMPASPDGKRWTLREVAKIAGVSAASIWRLCRANDLNVGRGN